MEQEKTMTDRFYERMGMSADLRKDSPLVDIIKSIAKEVFQDEYSKRDAMGTENMSVRINDSEQPVAHDFLYTFVDVLSGAGIYNQPDNYYQIIDITDLNKQVIYHYNDIGIVFQNGHKYITRYCGPCSNMRPL
jgi:hypothetical protein